MRLRERAKKCYSLFWWNESKKTTTTLEDMKTLAEKVIELKTEKKKRTHLRTSGWPTLQSNIEVSCLPKVNKTLTSLCKVSNIPRIFICSPIKIRYLLGLVRLFVIVRDILFFVDVKRATKWKGKYIVWPWRMGKYDTYEIILRNALVDKKTNSAWGLDWNYIQYV